MKRKEGADNSPSRRVSYEIVPGSIFSIPKGLKAASFVQKVRWQRLAEELFSEVILQRLGMQSQKIGAAVVRGGWRGSVNPSTQVIFSGDAPLELIRAYASALGLIWRQDAVAVMRLHPDGKCPVFRISRFDGRRLTNSQMDEFYRILYQADDTKEATIGFTEHDGCMLFINLPGGLPDNIFESVLTRLAEEHLTDDVFLDFARADFELESTDWSTDHGESYRKRLREAGRSDLLNWIETAARHEAESFLTRITKRARPSHKGRKPH